MLQSLASSGHSRDKKLMGEAGQMLQDSKAKIDYLRMRILKVKASNQHSNTHNGDNSRGIFNSPLIISN
jgi:protein kinase N